MPSFTITNRKKQEFVVHHDEEDTELLAQYTWHVAQGYVSTSGIRPDGGRYPLRMHRRIMEAYEGMEVDHVNGNPLDNRKKNLRFCTRAENMWNRSINKVNGSGFKGVYWHNQRMKFQAQIGINKKRKNLGFFQTALAAAHAYNAGAKKFFGEFARLNKLPVLSSFHRRNMT